METYVIIGVGVSQAIMLYALWHIYHNTNSMKDALVTATAKKEHAAGLEEGRIAGEKKAAVLVKAQKKKKE